MMDRIEEAKKELDRAIAVNDDPGAEFSLKVAQTHALVAIAESLQTLALAVRDSAIDVHEVK